MTFSVLLSIYHKELSLYLNEAFISIWDTQSLRPSEIVLVQDGPLTPELDEVIVQWQAKLGPVLKVIPLAQNIGLGKALNEGLKHCSYNWVFRMDTDDICMPDRFEKQVSYIIDHPEVTLLSGQIEEFEGKTSNIVAKRVVPLTHEEILKYAQVRSPFNHATIAMKKEIIEHLGKYQHHLLMEDYNLWIRVLANGYKTANLPDTLLLVRSDGMHGRRRGMNYIKSEWQLFQLKRSLKFQSTPKAFCLFLVRGLPRLLPASLLQSVYKLLRQ